MYHLLGDIRQDDFVFEVTNHSLYSITVTWNLSHRARSMKQAGFIKNFQYIKDDTIVNSSLNENYTFSKLRPNFKYVVAGKVITNDNLTSPPTFLMSNSTEFTLPG